MTNAEAAKVLREFSKASRYNIHPDDALVLDAAKAGAEALERGAWRPIETAPKDGTPIDVWCVAFSEETGKKIEVRNTDISWHDACEIFPYTGWVKVMDDGNWWAIENDEQSESLGFGAWEVTHYQPLPAGPEGMKEGDES